MINQIIHRIKLKIYNYKYKDYQTIMIHSIESKYMK